LYVSLAELTLDYGAVENREGEFVRAEPANMTAAATAALGEIPEELTFDLTNRPGKESYPIAGVIYAICTSAQPADRQKQTVEFLRWAVHEGQSDIARGTFAPLPPELVERVDKRLGVIKAL
jgi:phosphate transport system substrate-binding protein